MGLKYYLASRVENWDLVNEVNDCLRVAGWDLSYKWTENGVNGDIESLSREIKAEVSGLEINGVVSAEVMVFLSKAGRGAHIELGCALGTNKPVFLWAEIVDDLESSDGRITPFYYHKNVTRCICSRNDLVKNILAWGRRFRREVTSGL